MTSVTWIPLKRACLTNGQYGLNIPASDYVDEGIRLIRTSDLVEGRLASQGGIFVPHNAVSAEDLLEKDDLLLSRSGTVGRAFLTPPEASGMAFAGFLIRFRARPDVLPRYLYYCTQSSRFQADVQADAVTSTIQNFNADRYGNLSIPLRPVEAQAAIVRYLDCETAKIDELITEQQSLIELLVERRSAVVDSVVTAGLDRTAVTRDPGVPWLGAIPAHWQVRPLWSMFRRIKDVDHPEERMLSVFRDYGVVTKDSRGNINQTAENRSIYQLVHPGWLVTNRMKAWQGSVGISSLRGIVSGHYICFAPQHEEDDVYLNWLFRSPRYAAGYGLISRGVRIGQAEIDNDHYRLLPVVVPPLTEQKAIAATLDEKTAKIDILIDEAERFIELTRERRSALITASVAGDLDVLSAN